MPSDKRSRQKEGRRQARAARIAAHRRARRRRIAVWAGVVLVLGGGIAAALVLFVGDDDDAASESTTTTVPLPTTAPLEVPAGCDLERAPEAPPTAATYDAAPELTIDPTKTYTARLDTSCGEIVITLDAARAPQATNNFVFLAREGFYDGTTWHRVVGDFVIQGGDPGGTGTGGPGYDVVGEIPDDGYPAGAVAAAKSADAAPGSFGSQFFVVTAENGAQQLSDEYARFGTVTEGLEVARALAALEDPAQPEAPRAPLYIFSVEISES